MSFVVKSHHPWKTRVIWILAAVAILISGYSLFDYGRFLAGYDSADAEREREQLVNEKIQLRSQIHELRQQKALLERAAQIERRAYDELDTTLKSLQGEILELKEELAFYRGIVSPREASQGLHLQKFSIEANGPSRSYRYKVVLTQVLKNDRLATGKVELELDGIQGNQPKTLSFAEVSEKSVKDLDYRFKYFQNLEGNLEFPEGFTLLRAKVRILPRGRESELIEKTLDWSQEENDSNVGTTEEKA